MVQRQSMVELFKDFYNFFLERKFELYRISYSKLVKINGYNTELEYFRVSNFVAVNSRSFYPSI